MHDQKLAKSSNAGFPISVTWTHDQLMNWMRSEFPSVFNAIDEIFGENAFKDSTHSHFSLFHSVARQRGYIPLENPFPN
jgi:hypothetical protein